MAAPQKRGMTEDEVVAKRARLALHQVLRGEQCEALARAEEARAKAEERMSRMAEGLDLATQMVGGLVEMNKESLETGHWTFPLSHLNYVFEQLQGIRKRGGLEPMLTEAERLYLEAEAEGELWEEEEEVESGRSLSGVRSGVIWRGSSRQRGNVE